MQSRRNFVFTFDGPRRAITISMFAVVVVLVAGIRHQRTTDLPLVVAHGEALLQAGDPAAALRQFERAAKLAPEAHEVHYGMARALEAQGKRELALDVYETALEIADRNHWRLVEHRLALQNHAFACLQAGDVGRGVPSLARLHAESVGTLRTDALLVLAYLAQGDSVAAAHSYANMKSRYGLVEPVWRLGTLFRAPRAPDCSLDLVQAFVGIRIPSPSRQQIEREAATSATCDAEFLHVLLAETALNDGDLERATVAYEAATAQWVASRRDLGLAQIALGRGAPELALDILKRVSTENSVPRETILYLQARAHESSGDIAAFHAAVGDAADANPLSLRTELLRARVATRMGDDGAATVAYERALQIHPTHAETLFALGSLWITQGNPARGRALLARYLQFHPRGDHAAAVRRLLGQL